MIRQLRRSHRAITIVLTVALIVLFIAALSVRSRPLAPNAVRLSAMGGRR